MVAKYTLSNNTDFGGLFDSDQWVQEITESSIALSIDHAEGGVTTHDDTIETWFSEALSIVDEATFNALPANHAGVDWRSLLINDILSHRETRLETVILAEYPVSSGKQFGCSTANQDSWSKLATLDARGLVTYPFVVKTYDYLDSYGIVDSADLTAIIGTVSAAVLAERTLSESYIDLVIASTTEAEASAAIAPYLES